jgi:type II secretory pathway component GspD/PulD (secretin)
MRSGIVLASLMRDRSCRRQGRVGAVLAGPLLALLMSRPAIGAAEAEPKQPAAEVAAAQSQPADAPPATVPAAPPRSLDQPVSANFRDVDFRSALEFLADAAGVPAVRAAKAEEASKPVTLHLVEIPLRRALEYVVKGQGLVYRLDESAIYVSTLDEMKAEPLETRVYFLSQGLGLFTDFEPLSETRESVALQSVGIRRMTTIKDIISEVVPTANGSSISLEERTGALIVTHTPYYLEQVEALLAKLDILPIEVRIEARFIELTVTDTNEWGFDAELTSNLPLTRTHDADGTSGTALQLSATGTRLLRGTKTSFTDFSRQSSGEGLNLTFQGVLSSTQYSAVLHALAENKKTKTLSAPQVTTLNNQTATIKVVTEFVYASRYEASVKREDLNSDGDFNDVVSGTRETRFVNVPQDFVTKDLGILLNVTPSVGQDLRTVTLALKPEVSEKKTDDTFAGEITLPRFTSRYLMTSVVIDSGQTVVLGGLMKDTTSKTLTKVPLLGSLPLFGPLFHKRSESAERSNLLIFVTAHVKSAGSPPSLAQATTP